jgi:hypothetical protein
MTEQHPITPPPELVEQWATAGNIYIAPLHLAQSLATQAARWGWEQRGTANQSELQKARDNELEACLQWFSEFYCMETWMQKDLEKFRAARRPKTPTKEEALDELCLSFDRGRLKEESFDIIRRALEQLDG